MIFVSLISLRITVIWRVTVKNGVNNQDNHIHTAKLLIKKLAQTLQSLQTLKPFKLENDAFDANIKDTCLLELAENCPEILEIHNNARQQKIKSARAVGDHSDQDLNLKNPTVVHKDDFFKYVKQTEAEKNELVEKSTDEIQFIT